MVKLEEKLDMLRTFNLLGETVTQAPFENTFPLLASCFSSSTR